jgi:hypothetical protein
VDPAADDNEAIRRAAAGGHLEVRPCELGISCFVASRLDNAPLKQAIKFSRKDVVKLLLQRVVVDRSQFKQLGFSMNKTINVPRCVSLCWSRNPNSGLE